MLNKLWGIRPKWEEKGRKFLKPNFSVVSFLRTRLRKLNKLTCHWLLLPQPEGACAIKSIWNIAGGPSIAASQRLHPYFTYGNLIFTSQSLFMFYLEPPHGGELGSGAISPHILGYGSRWKWVFRNAIRPLYNREDCPRKCITWWDVLDTRVLIWTLPGMRRVILRSTV